MRGPKSSPPQQRPAPDAVSKTETAKPLRKAKPAAKNAVADFLNQMARVPTTGAKRRGRLIMAIDATLSRQPTWDAAIQVQGDMFVAAAAAGGLDVQLVYFRGLSECRASGWTDQAGKLGDMMSKVACKGGQTQIARVLDHVARMHDAEPIDAFVYVGDCVEESVDALCQKAGALGLKGVKGFWFREGRDPAAGLAMPEMARLMNGACLAFDSNAPDRLRELLSAIAAYAAGGLVALENHAKGKGPAAREILQLMDRRKG